MYTTCVFLFLFFSQSFGQFIPKLAVSFVKNKLLTAINKILDNECGADLKLFLSGLENRQLWALKSEFLFSTR